MSELNRQQICAALEEAVILAAKELAKFMLTDGFTLRLPEGKMLRLGEDRAVVKRCPRCDTFKPHAEFNFAKSKPDSLTTYCKICDKERRKKSRLRNADRERAANDLWRKKNPGYAGGYARDAAEKLTDTYVAGTLGFKVKEVPPILIETKRITLQIKRLLKEKK